ncbi:hypothetical protein FNJ87_04955 [Nonlabens mediterrranea]|uniref:Hydrolase n=1 Tax=Nonlabens mediterrranea TaxID=1419947 RepID=A0ABS0A2W0_9FLAO|nr:hypothetical protein BBFL7_00077 [Flavobacteria bacterium BBFL7]MBF4983707.1 hypothetical protein [Nonlabens mediterrranea]
MKRNLYLYLFIFASLIALILYVNGRNIQESQDKAYRTLEKKLEATQKQLNDVQASTADAAIFSLDNNEEAYNYFESSGLDRNKIESVLQDYLLEQNLKDGGNPLVDYIGEGRGYQINDIQVLNHKWLIANFTDNTNWGEVLIQYNFDKDNNLSMQTLKSVLYNKYR